MYHIINLPALSVDSWVLVVESGSKVVSSSAIVSVWLVDSVHASEVDVSDELKGSVDCSKFGS